MSTTATTPEATDASQIIQRALSVVSDIATLPEVTVKIISIVENPKSTARDLHEIIKQDPALSTKVLKVVNSAFYGLPGQIASLDRAIVLLGLSAVKNIAISASISRFFQSANAAARNTARELWRHSVAVAVATRTICGAVGLRAQAEEAFVAGLIHDLGLLIELQAMPGKFVQVVETCAKTQRPFCEIENEIIGADHAAFGEALAAKWKFPRAIRTVIGYHHKLDNLQDQYRVAPTIVGVADRLCAEEQIGFSLTTVGQTIEDAHLDVINMSRDDIEGIRAELPEHVEQAEMILTG